MSENEILARGIVVGMAIIIPFLGFAIGKWLSWKDWSKFWEMMRNDLLVQNERLFRELIREEQKSRCFESKLKHIVKMYESVKEADK